jgi:hypothetical protein
MKLINETKYQTQALKRFFIRALREIRKSEGSNPHFRNITIVCKPGRNWVTGQAAYHAYRVLLRIPSAEFVIKPKWQEEAKRDGNTARWLKHAKDQAMVQRDTLGFSLAWVYYHELRHNVGYDHRQMKDVTFKRLAEWAKEYGEIPLAGKQIQR